jgi:hypothetical protein
MSSAGSGSSSHARPNRSNAARTSNGLGHREALVRVDHELEGVAHRFADRGQPRDVLGELRLADLELRTPEALRLGFHRLRDQRFVARCSQPPSVV